MGCTSNALVHEDISKGGLGMASLLHPYGLEQKNTIVKCLHDNGRLGSITRHMLMKQIQNLGMVPGMCAWQDLRYCSIARKLAFMQEAGIDLTGPIIILLAGNPIHTVLKRLQVLIKGVDVSKMHRISVPLYEVGIWDFSRLTNGAARYMIDINALARLPNLCTKVTARHKRSLNRLTLLVNGHDWMGQAPSCACLSKHGCPAQGL